MKKNFWSLRSLFTGVFLQLFARIAVILLTVTSSTLSTAAIRTSSSIMSMGTLLNAIVTFVTAAIVGYIFRNVLIRISQQLVHAAVPALIVSFFSTGFSLSGENAFIMMCRVFTWTLSALIGALTVSAYINRKRNQEQ